MFFLRLFLTEFINISLFEKIGRVVVRLHQRVHSAVEPSALMIKLCKHYQKCTSIISIYLSSMLEIMFQ